MKESDLTKAINKALEIKLKAVDKVFEDLILPLMKEIKDIQNKQINQEYKQLIQLEQGVI